ncbi:MAG: WbuC family cupin fold metalloprotein [Gammaproteobacteria bacterium]
MKLFSRAALDELAGKATASPRKRAHYNVHASSADVVQRFFVAADRETYFRPHRHLTRSEFALVLRGQFDVITFDDTGRVVSRHSVGEGLPDMGFETPSATWHTLLSRADGSVFLEIKEGPYDPATAAEFAPWAPAEGDASVAAYSEWLRAGKPGESGVPNRPAFTDKSVPHV